MGERVGGVARSEPSVRVVNVYLVSLFARRRSMRGFIHITKNRQNLIPRHTYSDILYDHEGSKVGEFTCYRSRSLQYASFFCRVTTARLNSHSEHITHKSELPPFPVVKQGSKLKMDGRLQSRGGNVEGNKIPPQSAFLGQNKNGTKTLKAPPK